MFGQRVDYIGDSHSLRADGPVLPSPRDYIVTCAKTEAEAIQFSQEDEIQKYTLGNLFVDWWELVCVGGVSLLQFLLQFRCVYTHISCNPRENAMI